MRAAVLLTIALAAVGSAGPTRAQMPNDEALARAVQAMQPLAASLGLRLHLGPLWRQALQWRSPLVAALAGRSDCWLGYSAYAPGRDHQWLFPALPDDQRQRWLMGAVAHELAHCAEAADAAGRAAPPDEVLADLAFAWQLAQLGPEGKALVARLARLRAARRQHDPAHDTAAVLTCYLGEADRGAAAPTVPTLPGDGRWWQALRDLRARCGDPS